MRYGMIAAGLGLVLVGATAGAENWPRFRGPNGTGIAPTEFNSAVSAKDIAWKAALPGIGHSSPVVWGEHVYVTSADDGAGKRYVICLSAADGKVLWKRDYSFGSYHKHKLNSYASATPAADELGFYVVWTTPQEYSLLAFDHEGKERWKKSLGSYRSQHGSGSSPIVVGDLVVLNDDQEKAASALYAFDRTTGQQRWKVDHRSSGKAAMATPCLWKPASGPEQIIVPSFGGGIQSVDPQSGKLLWEATGLFFSRPVGSPVTTGDLVICVNGEGAVQRELVAVRPGASGEKPKLVYKIKSLGPHVPTPLVNGDRLILLNEAGQLTCVEAETGKTIWSEKLGSGFYGSPIISGDVLWAIDREGRLNGVNIASGMKPICKFDLGEPSQATPAVADGRMFLRTLSHLICVRSGQAR